jgi:hypothetical protein
MAIAALSEDRQRILSLLSHAVAVLFAPRPKARPPRVPTHADLVEAARAQYHATRAAYMRTPSVPGSAEEQAFHVAFQDLDLVRFGPRQALPQPGPQLRAAALRAARLRAVMAGRVRPDTPPHAIPLASPQLRVA